MKTMRLTGLFLAATLLSFQMMAQSQQLVVPLSDPGKPYKLSVELITGSITVTGYDGKDVVIDAEGEGRSRRERDHDGDADRSGMKRINPGTGIDITAKEKNNTVTVGSDIPNRSLNLTIKVPRNAANIKLSTINGGVISVNEVNGELELSNTNGAIKAADISGSVVANSINGAINIVFKSVDPRAPMAFSTLNGSVNVTFPANFKAHVKLKSDHGNVYSDFDVVSEGQPKVDKNSKDGMYRITVDETVYGKINGGGPELLMKTMNGSLYLHKAK